LRMAGICFLGIAVVPAPSMSLDLITAWEYALQHDDAYLGEVADLEAQKKGEWKAVADLGPKLDGSISLSRKRDWMRSDSEPGSVEDEDTAIDDRTRSAWYDEQVLSLSLRQPLFDMKRIHAAKKASLERDRVDVRLEKALEELIVKVATQYFAILDAKDALALAIAERKTLAEQVVFAKERRMTGMGTVLDLFDTEARYHLAQAKELEMKAALSDSWRDLWAMIGRVDLNITPLQKKLPPFHKEYDNVEKWIQTGMGENSDLNIRRIEADVFDYERKIASSHHFPIISLVADHAYTQTSDGLSGYGVDEKEYRYGVMASMPLFRSGETLLLGAQAGKKAMAAKKRLDMQVTHLDQALHSAHASMNTLYDTILAYRDAIAAGKNALEGKKVGYQEGVSTSLDVLDAQREYYRELHEYHKTRYRYILSVLNFKKLAGVLATSDLEWINRQLGE